MMTRPTPKKANVGVWGIVVILSAAAVLLPMAQARNPTPQSANTDKPNGGYRILLLDDKDAQFWSKEQYDDRLYLIDPKGRIEGAVTGFNLCQSPGGCHALAVDAERRTLWVADNRGRRLWHFDLAGGKLLRQVPLSRVDAVALDPATGNAWCLVSEGPIDAGSLQVISPAGEPLAKYPIVGLDIAYSRHDASFWIVGKDIVKVSREGKVLGRIAGRIPWYAVSVSMDQKTGNAWVVIRDHPQVAESKPQVWVVDPEMDVRTAIELGDLTPFCVAVDSGHGIAWVGCYGTTLRFTTKGEKLPSARGASGFSVAAGGPSDPVLVAGERGLAVAATPEAGRLWLTFPPDDLRGLLSSSHKWVAIVPWGGAKLPSSPELADLIDSEPTRVEEQKAHPITVMGHLRQVVPAAMAYAEEHQGRFASDLAELKPYFGDDARFVQIVDNVEYLGKGVQQAELTAGGSRPLAYWKTTTTNDCIAVVFFDGHAEVVKGDRLAELGIDPKP